MSETRPLTRAAALDRLAAVTPRLGHAYTDGRNTDAGPHAETTSVLSPYLRRRLILEQDVVATALAAHGPQPAAKFIEEVFWRTYFKGHLETHPAIWDNTQRLIDDAHAHLVTQPFLRRTYTDALAGQTGIDGFDAWATQLTQTGWLHNHARMWFASIWIFTLRLPWALGADFFLRHLCDGDPASNTLSWRWVAGLHTRGKHYIARAENIRRYTDGRFSPQNLNENPAPLHEPDPAPTVALPPAGAPPVGDVALLLHLDDLHPESLPLGPARVKRIAGLLAHAPNAADPVRLADQEAMADALARAAAHFDCPAAPHEPGWADTLPVITAWAPVGPSATALPPGTIQLRRSWDQRTWPRATRGYFQVKTAIPAILHHTCDAPPSG